MAAVTGAAGAVRPGSESPLGSNWASPPVVDSGAGSAEVSEESAFAGAAATGAAAGTAAGAACAAEAGSVGTSGSVSDAVALPGGGVAGVAGAAAGAAVPDMAFARVCINIGAAEPTVPSWVSSWEPGSTGAGGTGSAAAVALSDSAETAPAAAIMDETNSFRVRFMVLPIVGRRRPEPEARWLLL